MSGLADGRADIRAALDAVTGIKSYDKQPAAPRAGDAWLRWRGDVSDESVGQVEFSWTIVVMTPQGEAAADAWIDDHLDDLLAGLRRATYVTGVGPGNIGTDASPIDCLIITSNRE